MKTKRVNVTETKNYGEMETFSISNAAPPFHKRTLKQLHSPLRRFNSDRDVKQSQKKGIRDK